MAKVRGEIDFEIAANNTINSLAGRAASASGLNEMRDLLAEASSLESKYGASLAAKRLKELRASLILGVKEATDRQAAAAARELQRQATAAAKELQRVRDAVNRQAAEAERKFREQARSGGRIPVVLELDPIPPAENVDEDPEDDQLSLTFHAYNVNKEPVSCSGTLVVKVYERRGVTSYQVLSKKEKERTSP